MIRKFKIVGCVTEKDFAQMSFGQSIDTLRAFEKFKREARSVHLSQKRKTYQKAIREAIALYDVKEYYCHFGSTDDVFQFFYKS